MTNSSAEVTDALLRENAELREQNDELRRALAQALSVRPSAAPANESAARGRMYEHFAVAPFLVAALVGPDHVIEFANAMALAAWGKTGAAIGKPILEAVPELRGQPFNGYLDRVRATGVAYRGFSELARLARVPGGAVEDAYYDFVYSPMGLPDGAVDGVLLFAFEVTAEVRAQKERLQMIEEVRAAERHLRDVIDNLPDLAWTTLADGRADFYNRRWYEFTGTHPDDIKTMGVRTVDDPVALDAIRVRWRECLATGQPFDMEHTLRGGDGGSRWFLTRVRPLRDGAGRSAAGSGRASTSTTGGARRRFARPSSACWGTICATRSARCSPRRASSSSARRSRRRSGRSSNGSSAAASACSG